MKNSAVKKKPYKKGTKTRSLSKIVLTSPEKNDKKAVKPEINLSKKQRKNYRSSRNLSSSKSENSSKSKKKSVSSKNFKTSKNVRNSKKSRKRKWNGGYSHFLESLVLPPKKYKKKKSEFVKKSRNQRKSDISLTSSLDSLITKIDKKKKQIQNLRNAVILATSSTSNNTKTPPLENEKIEDITIGEFPVFENPPNSSNPHFINPDPERNKNRNKNKKSNVISDELHPLIRTSSSKEKKEIHNSITTSKVRVIPKGYIPQNYSSNDNFENNNNNNNNNISLEDLRESYNLNIHSIDDILFLNKKKKISKNEVLKFIRNSNNVPENPENPENSLQQNQNNNNNNNNNNTLENKKISIELSKEDLNYLLSPNSKKPQKDEEVQVNLIPSFLSVPLRSSSFSSINNNNNNSSVVMSLLENDLRNTKNSINMFSKNSNHNNTLFNNKKRKNKKNLRMKNKTGNLNYSRSSERKININNNIKNSINNEENTNTNNINNAKEFFEDSIDGWVKKNEKFLVNEQSENSRNSRNLSDNFKKFMRYSKKQKYGSGDFNSMNKYISSEYEYINKKKKKKKLEKPKLKDSIFQLESMRELSKKLMIWKNRLGVEIPSEYYDSKVFLPKENSNKRKNLPKNVSINNSSLENKRLEVFKILEVHEKLKKRSDDERNRNRKEKKESLQPDQKLQIWRKKLENYLSTGSSIF